ncbi:MAG: PEGA domain-containing protein [Pseudomonadota bacterium]
MKLVRSQNPTFFWPIFSFYDLSQLMSGVRLNRITSGVLILLFLSWQIAPGFASDSTQNTTSVIIKSYNDEISDEVSEDSAAALRQVLPKISNTHILSPELVKNVLNYYQKESSSFSQEKQNAIQNLTQSKDHYFSFHYDEALAEVASAIDFFSKGDLSKNGAMLQDSLLTQGVIAKAAGKKDLAQKSFESAVKLDPFYKIDRMLFAPSVVALYEEQQTEIFNQEKGSLKIDSTPPAAEIYINGILHGVTPLEYPEVPVGAYNIVIKTNKYQPVEKNISLQAGQKVLVKEKLRWSDKKEVAAPKPTQDTRALINEGIQLADLLKADKAILINCDETKNGNVIVARMVDRKYRAGYRAVVYEYKTIEERPQAIAGVAKVLAAQADANLLDDPMQYLDPDGLGDPILLGARKNKIYKRPWFWATIGGLAAAALAGGLVAAFSSGGGSSGTGSVNVEFK